MKKFLIFMLVLIISGCSSKENLDNKNYKELMKNNDYVILDVRTKEEYDLKHIKGAINIPYDTIDSSIDINKEKLVFVYCRSGNRSNIAKNTLEDLGYKVYDLGAFLEIDLESE